MFLAPPWEGPIMKNRLFFFANYEGRRDAQGTSVLRTVPSATLRAGNLVYLCATIQTATCPGGTVNGVSGVQPGYYALGPDQIKAMDPLHIGISPAVMSLLQQYPAPTRTPVTVPIRSAIVSLRTPIPASTPTSRDSITTSPPTARKRCSRAERRRTSSNPDSNSFPARALARRCSTTARV